MKRAGALLTVILFSLIAVAQNKSSYFKTIPGDLSAAPDWAKTMYSDDPNVGKVEYQYYQYYQSHPFEKTIHTQNFKHWMMQVRDLVNENGKIREDFRNSIFEDRKGRIENRKPKTENPEWKLAGPVQTYNFPEQGGHQVSWQANVYCFDQCVSNPLVCYAGIEGGGLYKSTNKGMSWSMVTKDVPMSTVVDVKVAPSNEEIIYFTSSERIFKSADGGYNWEIVYELGDRGLQLLIHPDNPEIVFCAAENGLYKTVDGGTTWDKKLNQTCWDIQFKPANPATVYVLQNFLAEKRCLFLKSIDTGESFISIEEGWFTPDDGDIHNDIGGKIGVTPADPDRVYAALIGESKADDNGWIGVFRSNDSGDSWINPNPPTGGPYDPVAHPNLATINPNGTGFHQGFFNFALAVSHTDPDLLWVGTLSLNRSTNGGESWVRIGAYNAQEDIGWIHPDIQDLHVLGSDVWVSCDGGINYSNDELQTHHSRNMGLAGSNLWGFGQGWNEDVMVGGRYHNGNFGYYQEYPDGFSLRLGGAEASTGYVNPQFNRLVYFSDISTNMLPESMSGNQVSLPKLSVYPNEAYTESHSSEMEWDPRYSDHIYVGNGGSLFKSINGGGYFEQLYSFGTTARVLEIEISRSNPDVIYVVSQPGGGYWDACYIYRSEDGGQTFSRTKNVPSSSRWRTEITINPENENELWVMSITGSNGRKVYRTLDGGQSWENMTSDLIDEHRPQDIKFQAGSSGYVYLVTIAGAFYYDPNIDEWVSFSDGLPLHTRAMEMKFYYSGNKIRLATGGHAVWENDLVAPSRVIAQPMTETDTIYKSRDTVLFDSHSVALLEGATFEWSISPEPEWISSSHTRAPAVVFGRDGSYDVTLKVRDKSGQTDSRTEPKMVTVMDLSGVDGKPGKALETSASGDYMVTSDFNLTTEQLTVMAWVKPDDIQPDYTGIAISSGETAGMNFRGGNNTLGYHWPGGSWSWNSGLIVQPYKWSHVALVADQDKVTLYVDGIGVTHQADIDPVLLSSFSIGSYKGWASRNFSGLIDEVSFWSRPLSEEEIRGLMHVTLEDYTDNPDLLAYYQFNEPNGPVLDKSGSVNAELYGGAVRSKSSAPLGSGISAKQTLDFGGQYDFGETGVRINVPVYGHKPDGDVYVTRISGLPNVLPNDHPNAGTYWIIDNYGETVFESLGDLQFAVAAAPSHDVIEEPQIARLFKRRPDTDLNAWESLCLANQVEGDTATVFKYNESCRITQFGQFVILSEDPDKDLIQTGSTGVADIQAAKESVKVYPNPVLSGENIRITHERPQNFRFRLFSPSGKMVRDLIVDGQQSLSVSTTDLSSGLYFYQIRSAKAIRHGNLIIY